MANQNEFACPRCGYRTEVRGLIKKHLSRKVPCDPLLRNITVEEILLENPHFEAKIPAATKRFECPDCLAKFTRKSAMERHCAEACEFRIDNRVQELEYETQTLRYHLNQLTNQIQVLMEER